jgi:hypothetical protein
MSGNVVRAHPFEPGVNPDGHATEDKEGLSLFSSPS